MVQGQLKEGIAAGRLAPEQYAENFADLHPPHGGAREQAIELGIRHVGE